MRRDALLVALAAVRRPQDLGALPPNDLASSPVSARLREAGAFRADVSGAGPCVYGLFVDRERAEAAAQALRAEGQTWVVDAGSASRRDGTRCVYRRGMSGLVVEHRESQFSRRLRRRRVQIAVGIAAVEAVLVVAGILPWWLVVAAAAGSVALYLWVGRDHMSPGVRAATWLAAVSQLIVVLVPVGLVVVGFLAILVVAILAAVALAVLLLDRR